MIVRVHTYYSLSGGNDRPARNGIEPNPITGRAATRKGNAMTTRMTQLLTGTTLSLCSIFSAAPALAEHDHDSRRPQPVRYEPSRSSTAVGFRINTGDFGVNVGYRDSKYGGERFGVNIRIGDDRRWVPAHYVERHTQVLVEPAHYEDRHTQVLVQAGHFQERHTRVLVVTGHWAEQKVPYVSVPGHYEMRHIPAVTRVVHDHYGRCQTVIVSPERCERVWVPDVIDYRCQNVWVPERYENRCEKIWVPDRYETRCEKVFVPARYETRCEKVYVPGRWETCR